MRKNIQIAKDWIGQSLSQAASFSITLENHKLIFTAEAFVKPTLMPNVQANTFIEGLWEYDVAELFIALNDQDYLELNLAPSANWWLAKFAGYRNRQKVLDAVPANIQATAKHDSWSAQIELDVTDLGLENLHHELKYNVCMILGADGDHNSRSYLSYHLPQSASAQPDFHLSELRRS